MTPLVSLVLGIIQGLTEFLPISSSGHLVLAEKFFDVPLTGNEMQGLNVMLHAGTLVALLFCYAGTWWKMLKSPFVRDHEQMHLLLLIIVATIPGAVVGLLGEDLIASLFQGKTAVVSMMIATAIILILGEHCHPHIQKRTLLQWLLLRKPKKGVPVTTSSALAIGFAQAVALIPGLSRSGLTISAGRAAGLTRKDALDFSFLMAVPIIAGASLVTFVNVVDGSVILPAMRLTTTGVLASFGMSVLAILFLRRFVLRYSLSWFAIYLFLVAGLVMLLL